MSETLGHARFRSRSMGVDVVVTFRQPADSDQVKVDVSVRPRQPLPPVAVARISSLWMSWVARMSAGAFPALPDGWRFIDGATAGATAGTPDHHH